MHLHCYSVTLWLIIDSVNQLHKLSLDQIKTFQKRQISVSSNDLSKTAVTNVTFNLAMTTKLV